MTADRLAIDGEVVALEPVSINLADGRYLRLGLGLQATAEVEEELDGSKALDAAISLYSGRPMAELSDPAQRDALKEELAQTIAEELASLVRSELRVSA